MSDDLREAIADLIGGATTERHMKCRSVATGILALIEARGLAIVPVGARPISTAPRDGSCILARVADLPKTNRHWHYAGRCFVVFHMGLTQNGTDMGWTLFPGMGVGDDFFSVWWPMPPAMIAAARVTP